MSECLHPLADLTITANTIKTYIRCEKCNKRWTVDHAVGALTRAAQVELETLQQAVRGLQDDLRIAQSDIRQVESEVYWINRRSQ